MTTEVKPNFPAWIQADIFEQALKEAVPEYKKCKIFNVRPGMAAGENYATVMLKVQAEVELNDGSSKTITFMLKTAHDNEMFKEMMKKHNLFDIEKGVYDSIVPEFEKLYADAGLEVKFGAKSYNLPTEEWYILLEDLSAKGFKNANRLEGLDMDHTKCVLLKLAQWHAASAVRVAQRGFYESKYTHGYFLEHSKPMMEMMMDGMGKIFLECAKDYSNYSEYAENLAPAHKEMVPEFYRYFHHDPKEFNVLNHGDAWSNNVMFQYDAFGKIKETYLVDYQLPKYGTPAQDLFYFILSSAKYEIKTAQFDYFIKYYHDQLVEHLKLLKYSKKIPSLCDIHVMLYKYGVWGYSTVTGVMGAVLLDPSDKSNLDNFMSDTADGVAFKKQMFSNARYRKHMEMLLPWLQNRGALSY